MQSCPELSVSAAENHRRPCPGAGLEVDYFDDTQQNPSCGTACHKRLEAIMPKDPVAGASQLNPISTLWAKSHIGVAEEGNWACSAGALSRIFARRS